MKVAQRIAQHEVPFTFMCATGAFPSEGMSLDPCFPDSSSNTSLQQGVPSQSSNSLSLSIDLFSFNGSEVSRVGEPREPGTDNKNE